MEHEFGPRRRGSQLPTRHTLAPSDPNQASQLMLSQTSGNPGTPEGLGVQPKVSIHHDEPYGARPRPAAGSAGHPLGEASTDKRAAGKLSKIVAD